MLTLAMSLLEPTSVAATFVLGGAIGAALSRVPAWRRAPTKNIVMRSRTGRLPLPQPVAAMNETNEPSLERVNAFVDELSALPCDRWLSIGATLVDSNPTRPARLAARQLLDATLAKEGLGVSAWYVRDAVETAAFLASNSRRLRAADRHCFARAHGAAEVAALALLAKPFLSDADFDTLHLPFADLEPADATA